MNSNRQNHDLRRAAFCGWVKDVRLLIQKGADINSRNKNGTTPLMLAAASGYLESVRFLVRRGANIHLKDNQGMTALMYAKMNEEDGIIIFLESVEESTPTSI